MQETGPYKQVSLTLILELYLSVVVMSFLYWLVGTSFFHSPLRYRDYLVFTSVLAFVIVGCYQLFFWTEHNNGRFRTRTFHLPVDDRIPFVPGFVWVYSFSYYAVIGLVVATLPSLEKGLECIFGALVLLTIQCALFFFFPCSVPRSWRDYYSRSSSTRFLRFVQRLDRGANCMPSMHMSVAMYVSLLLFPSLSYYAFLFVLLIGVSCLLVKQHVMLDLPPGIALGWLVHAAVT
jgi:hypothetical protein